MEVVLPQHGFVMQLGAVGGAKQNSNLVKLNLQLNTRELMILLEHNSNVHATAKHSLYKAMEPIIVALTLIYPKPCKSWCQPKQNYR